MPCGPDDPLGMAEPIRVVVQAPSPTGGLRVRVNGEILGLAQNVGDVAEFLRRAYLEIDPCGGHGVAVDRLAPGGAGQLGAGGVVMSYPQA